MIVRNNYIKIDKSDPYYETVRDHFIIVERNKNKDKEDIVHYLYEYDIDDNLLVYPGLEQFIPTEVPRIYDLYDELISRDMIDSIDFDDLSRMSEVVTLRDDQIIAIRKMMYLKNGMLQLPTGVGKTEIISGFLYI